MQNTIKIGFLALVFFVLLIACSDENEESKNSSNHSNGDSSTSTTINSSKAQQWGTSSSDVGRAIVLDSTNQIYITGSTNGTLDGQTHRGNEDIFLVKYNASVSRQWTEQLGTSASEVGAGLAIDSANHIYVTGYTYGALGTTSNQGSKDIFLAKYHSNGTQTWSQQFGSISRDEPKGIAIDSSDNIYITGQTSGILQGTTHQGGTWDIFLAKYHSNGNQAWSQQIGTSGSDSGSSLAIDSSDAIYITGSTTGLMAGSSEMRKEDLFLVKYDSSGSKQWVQQLGTSATDMGQGIAIDSSDNIYITGFTNGALDGNTHFGGQDIFLVKYDSSGNKQWTKQLGTSAEEIGQGIAIDSSDNIYITGFTNGALDGNTHFGEKDIFLVKYDSSGSKQWVQQLGTSVSEMGQGIAIDSSNQIYLTGETNGDLQGNTNIGSTDVFVVKYNSSGQLQ